MPTALHFNAQGFHNGLAFCDRKVDVSIFDHWTTFGGTNKGNVDSLSAEQLATNRANSMTNMFKLFWLFHRIDAYHDFDSDGAFYDSIDVEGNNSRPADSSTYFGEPEPRDRIAYSSDGGGGYGNHIHIDFPSTNLISLAFDNQQGGVSLTSFGPYVRMYNGPTNSESNFVGWGFYTFNGALIARNTTSFGNLRIYSASSGCSVQLTSYGDVPTISSGEITDEAYVQLGGIDFLCCAWSRNTNLGVSGIADASTLFASWTRSSNYYETQISSISFYDLPA